MLYTCKQIRRIILVYATNLDSIWIQPTSGGGLLNMDSIWIQPTSGGGLLNMDSIWIQPTSGGGLLNLDSDSLYTPGLA